MKNKTISYWVAGTIGLAFLGGMLDAPDDFYTVAGFGIIVFGLIAAHRLYNTAD